MANSLTNGIRIGFNVAHASPASGGIVEVIKGLGSELLNSGADVKIFCGEDQHLRAGEQKVGSLDAVVLPVRGPRQYGYQSGLLRAVTQWRPTSMHIHGLWMYPSWATHHWRQLNLPYVVSPHGMLDKWALASSPLKKTAALFAFERASLNLAACIHVLSEAELNSVRENRISAPVAVIQNGVTLPELISDRKVFPRTLLYLGRLHPKKGVSELLKAWRLVSQQNANHNWRLLVAGWGTADYANELRQLTIDLDISNSVDFTGPVYSEQKERLFREASGFVLPSKSEGMPMAVLEAWSHGLPVLMSQHCNLPMGFERSAAVAVSCDVPALGDVLLQFIQLSDAERAAVGANGRRLVEEMFRWETAALQLRAVHMWISGASDMPDNIDIVSANFSSR